MDYFIDRQEIARILSVSMASVDRLLKQGANGRPPIPAKKLGRSVRIKITDFERWIESQPTPVKPIRGRPRGSTKAAIARRRAAEAQAEMSPTP